MSGRFRLDKLRLKRGLTWDSLGLELKLSRSMLHYLRKGERQLSDRALSRLAAAESAAGIFYPVESPRVTAATTMQFQAGFKEFMAALQFMNNQIQADPELRALPFEQALERWRQKHDKNP